jgi:Tol biopolymer transport system component
MATTLYLFHPNASKSSRKYPAKLAHHGARAWPTSAIQSGCMGLYYRQDELFAFRRVNGFASRLMVRHRHALVLKLLGRLHRYRSMRLPSIQLALFVCLSLFTSSVVAGSPMSWSPDGEWLSYTIVTEATQDALRPGWLFTSAIDPAGSVGHKRPPAVRSAPEGAIYRIWATHRDSRPSILIEESRWPLTAPSWSPRGKSIAFGRFVPISIETTQAVQRGRLDIVIQDGRDRKHVVWSVPDLDLDPGARADLPNLSCSWSPDGLYLAVPRHWPQPAVDIVRTDTMKCLHKIDSATQPTWSPDGTKCAFVRPDGQRDILAYVERRGQTFGDSRHVSVPTRILTHPYWSSDCRSILAVVARSQGRLPELEIMRFNLEPGDSTRVMSLIPEPIRRTAKLRGLSLDFDRDAERCFFSVDLEARDSDIVWSIPREKETRKRFHPLDQGQRIDSLAVSPDGQLVATRIASPYGLMSPVLYDCETEQTRLLIPDMDARREWLATLASAAGVLLKASLPPAMADGQVASRPTVLPLPGELAPQEPAVVRVNRLARFGAALCMPAFHRLDGGDAQSPNPSEAEARFFFNYVRGEFVAAAHDLETLEACFDSPHDRLCLLSLRAQILWARGERSEALAVIAYLLSSGEPNRQLVEETPFGLVFSPVMIPTQAWARYLSARAADALKTNAEPARDPVGNAVDPHEPDALIGIPDMPFLEKGVRAVPLPPQGE